MNTKNDKGMISACMLASSIASITVGLVSVLQTVIVTTLTLSIVYPFAASLLGAVIISGSVIAITAAIMLLSGKDKGRLIALAAPVAGAIGAVIWGIVLKVFPLDRLIYAGIYFGMSYFGWAYFAGGPSPKFSDFIGSVTSIFNSKGFEAERQPAQMRSKCPKCGGKMDAGSAFCPHCGAKVE